MIVKGRSRTDGGALGQYLLSVGSYAKNREANERITVWDATGYAEGVPLPTLLHSWERSAETTRCAKPLYHLQMRSAVGEHLTRAQWLQCVDKAEAAHGLTGHERVIVAHTKDGQEHVHVVWNRIDWERGKAVEMRYDWRTCLEVAREMEHELGLRQLGQERDGKLSAKEEAAVRRHGKDPQMQKDLVQTCWEQAASGQAFTRHLDTYGMILAKGDTRGYLAVDRDGDFYLVSRTTGSTAQAVRAKLADVDRDALPTLEEARAQQHARHATDLFRQQQRDRDRLDAHHVRELQRLVEPLTAPTTRRDREAPAPQREARLGAPLYAQADLVRVQRDALRHLRERLEARDRQERPAQAQPRREAVPPRDQRSAYERTVARHAQQRERLLVVQREARRRAGVVDLASDVEAQRPNVRPLWEAHAVASVPTPQQATSATPLTPTDRARLAAQALMQRTQREREQAQARPPGERLPETSAQRLERLAREGGSALTAQDRARLRDFAAHHPRPTPREGRERDQGRERDR